MSGLRFMSSTTSLLCRPRLCLAAPAEQGAGEQRRGCDCGNRWYFTPDSLPGRKQPSGAIVVKPFPGFWFIALLRNF